MLPAFAYRRGNKVRLLFEPPLLLTDSGDHDSDVRQGMREFTRVMERHIRGRPEEWTIFEPFFDRG